MACSERAGLSYGGGFGVLKAQVIGSAAVTATALASGLALMYLVNATGTLRVSAEGELEGSTSTSTARRLTPST
jgi:Amt family ammonium transporter